MKVHIVSDQPHYMRHLRAIHAWLPDGLKGEIREGPHASAKGIPEHDVVMVAGFGDIPPRHRTIYVEHGAGQTYVDAQPSMARYYSGGNHPHNVIAYLGPRREVVDRWDKPGYAIGAPICDPYDLFGEDDTVVITFHWNGRRVAPEAGTALHHYIDQLPEIVRVLRKQGATVLGHRHPRLIHPVHLWSALDVPEVDYDEAMRRGSTFILDNSSIGYEAAYSMRNTIWLNCPEYRRDVHHGLRFWTYVPGPQMDSPDMLLGYLEAGGRGGWDGDIVRYVYGKPSNDGEDGLRAAAAVTAVVHAL